MEYDLLLMLADREYCNAPFDSAGQQCLASFLFQRGFSTRLYAGDPTDSCALMEAELERGATGKVGFFMCAQNAVLVKNMVRKAKRRGAKCIVGGPQAIGVDEAGLRELGCDYLIDGEGEIPLSRLMAYLMRGEGKAEDIPGLRYIDADGQYHADIPMGDPVEDLDTIGFADPDWVLTPRFRERSLIFTLTGRGCPYHCAFCHEGKHAKRLRMRSVENVMAEIDHIRSYDARVKYVMFGDDTFTLDARRALALAKGMKQRGLYFFCEGHVQTLCRSPGLIKEMVDCGMLAMQIGIESGSEKVLDAYHKHTKPQMIRQVVREAKEAGLLCMDGNFILGGAFEDDTTFAQSLELACELVALGRGMLDIHAVYLTPFPQTEVSTAPGRFGLCPLPEQQAYSLSGMHNCVFETEALSRADIQRNMERFEKRVGQAVREAARTLTKSELLHYHEAFGGEHQVLNWLWTRRINEEEYLQRFFNKGLHAACENDPRAVVVRSFKELRYSDTGALLCAGRQFDGLEKQFLEQATGRHTLPALAARIGAGEQEARRIFRALNEACLAYLDPV